jgi:DNA (cytosine-5)-methyltransferase 1
MRLFPALSDKPTVIDLFCGAGGLSCGFEQAGFQVLVGNDHFPSAGKTFERTHPEAKFLGGPIEDYAIEDFLKASRLKSGELDCLIGGPPCQAFSVYNHQRGLHDDRASLFKEYLRLVEGLQPKWIVMENVTGIFSAGGGKAVEAIENGLNALGYDVEYRTLKAEEYGVPQERRRVVFIGNRVNKPIVWPDKTHGPDAQPHNTIRDAIGDLPQLCNGEQSTTKAYKSEPQSHFQHLMRSGSNGVTQHSAPKLGAINIERMKHIPPGGSWRDIPFDMLPAGMKKAKRSDHTKRYGRMTWEGLSCTVLTKCDVHWGAYIHPEQDRSISVREAARLQSFPDWFEFQGSRTEQYVQIGNAVPPLLGRQIAFGLLRAMKANTAKAQIHEVLSNVNV